MKEPKFFSGRNVLILFVLLLVVGTSAAVYFKKRPNDDRLKASGTVEVTQVQLAPLAGGRIEELTIKEADHVEKGQLIARLSLDGADDEVKMAEFALAAARAQLEELNNGFRKEDIARARAEVDARRARAEQAGRDERRFSELAADGVVAKRDAELSAEAAKSSRSAVRAAEEQLRLLENGARSEQIAAAQANAERAEAAYKKAKTLVGYKEFYSPADGVVLTKNYEVGDVVNAGAPIATLGDMEDCWVKLYIPSSQLGRVKLGSECSVRIDAFPDREFEASVSEVNQQAEYNPRMSLTQKERENMVFWIKVRIKNTEGVIKPGMPADVTVL
ncbi:HlyD family secretion protein [Synergistes jonesii]|uniref:HlyD family secretion protein n=1 Tax=Synergistes jonesii TaxID=2754 RepID=UPI0024314F0D|nr:efflux RND transporter periplasmic adaptor subunit [Synergistes jonesii]